MDVLIKDLQHYSIIYKLPELDKAADEITRLRADLAAVTAERDRMQHRLDAAYNVIDKDIKKDMAFAEKYADLWLENEKLREALKPFVELGLTEAKKKGLWGPKAVVSMYVRYESISAARAALEGVKEPTK